VDKQLGPLREHLQKLLGDREDSTDDQSETYDRNMSQQDKDKAVAVSSTRHMYVYSFHLCAEWVGFGICSSYSIEAGSSRATYIISIRKRSRKVGDWTR